MPRTLLALASLLLAVAAPLLAQKRARELGIAPGVLPPGPLNAITDVAGVRVGHVTLIEGDSIRTGVTAILPQGGNLFLKKVACGIHVGNAFGKLAGSTQVAELGTLETPIILTNTLNVAEGIAGAVEWTLAQPGNESVVSVNAVVGETNDSRLNDIRRRFVTKQHVVAAIGAAREGPVEEGAVGAGTGTVCFSFKGGIGTSSRVLPKARSAYTAGVLVQTNFGGVLSINGAPIGKELGVHFLKSALDPAPGGSCMVVVATDAPLDARNLQRLAARAMLGLGVTGSPTTHGSGEYVIAFSTKPVADAARTTDEELSALFQAVKEATEEAVYNSLFMANTTTGHQGRKIEALPVDRVLEILRSHKLLDAKP
jgi:D-aminopeptidase